jgi:excisionase family DNA binding protein
VGRVIAQPESRSALVLPQSWVETIAERAAELALERGGNGCVGASPYLSVTEAAEYIRAKRQRIYDLLSARRLTRFKDGRRVLVARAELDAYLVGRSSVIAPGLPLPLQTRIGKTFST